MIAVRTVLTNQMLLGDNSRISTSNTQYKRHRFPAEIIQYAVRLYHRINFSNRDTEDMMAERGNAVSSGSIRLRCIKFRPQYANDHAELSRPSTRVRERGMRRLKSRLQARRFLSIQAVVHNLFNLGRNLVSAKHYRLLRQRAYASWEYATAL